MTDYHSTYKRAEGESTQWEDLQRKLGNLAPAPKAEPPPAYAPEQEEPKGKALVDSRVTEEELEELEDDFADDRVLEEYRRKRLEELRRGPKILRFGSLEEIRGSEFVAKVTNAGEGIWVVCHLYKAAVQDCAILNQCLAALAEQYPATKFVKIVSTDCIPNYPDENLPTVLLYRDTKCLQTLVGLRLFGGRGTSPDQVAISLNRFGDVCGDAEEQAARLKDLLGRLVDQQAAAAQRGGAAGGSDEDSDFD